MNAGCVWRGDPALSCSGFEFQLALRFSALNFSTFLIL